MKILLVYRSYSNLDFFSEIAIGGIETFCKLIYRHYDNIELLQVKDYLSLDLSKSEKIKKRLEVQSEIIKKSKDINSDLIILNWFDSSFTGRYVIQSQIPILYICHCMENMFSITSQFVNIKKHNHSLFFVSEYQKNYYEGMFGRSNSLLNFDGYIEPSFIYCDKPKLIETPENDCVTIRRSDPKKNPFLLKTISKDTNFKTLVMSNRVQKFDMYSYSYYNTNKNYDDIFWDLKHEDVLKNLSNCKTYLMTWTDECFPVTGLEALSRGLPLIINSRMTEKRTPTKRQNYKYPLHGANGWPVDKSHYVNIMKNSRDEFIEAVNKMKNIDRQEIQDMTWEKYTEKRWKSILDNAIDKTVENFKSKIGVLPI